MKNNVVVGVLAVAALIVGGWFIITGDRSVPVAEEEVVAVNSYVRDTEGVEDFSKELHSQSAAFKQTALMKAMPSNLAASVISAGDTTRAESNMFFYAGVYEHFETAENLGAEMARHDVAVMTHAYDARNGAEHWVNGNCVDYTDEILIESIQIARSINPDLEIYGYISATADNVNCYAPEAPPQLSCPDGICIDVINWVNRWIDVEHESGEYIDGIFVDLFGTQFIGPVVRDNVLSYIHLMGKKAMLNSMFGGVEILFALNSPYFDEKRDSILFEGFYVANGQYYGLNAVNNGMLAEIFLNPEGIRWAAISTEKGGADYSCDSQNAVAAYNLFKEYGGWAFSYQSSDLGLVNDDTSQSCAP